MIAMFGHNYTEDEVKWLKRNRRKHRISELTRLFNKKFGLDISYKALQQACIRRNIEPMDSGGFKKGNTPWNAGMKGIHLTPDNEFKKGIIPHNILPIGAERVSKGIVYVKIGMPNRWKSKHQLIWEQEHGPVPKGHIVVFIGEKNDYTQLACVSRKELMVLNGEKFTKQHMEIRPVLVNLVKLEQKIKK